jgi:5,10-methylenetetrahydrofolate reductase
VDAGDLVGASSALGLWNMLLVTGDPPKMGPYPGVTAVFDKRKTEGDSGAFRL